MSNPVPAYTVSITAAPGQVHPGDKVTYTMTVRNNGAVDYTADRPAVVSDDLSQVLDDAKYDEDATRNPTLADQVLTWKLAIPSGAIIALTFTVTITDPDVGDGKLINALTTPAGGNCVTGSNDPNCVANEVGLQSFTTTLTASTAVTHPGEVVTYTIAVHNTGTVDYTAADPSRFSDDLAGLLDDGTYQNDATGTPTLTGAVLSWSFALAGRGERDGDVFGARRRFADRRPPADRFGGDAGRWRRQLPAGRRTMSRASRTSTRVQSYVVSLTASTGVALPGDKVTYTVTVKNTGSVDYSATDHVSVTDSLARDRR